MRHKGNINEQISSPKNCPLGQFFGELLRERLCNTRLIASCGIFLKDVFLDPLVEYFIETGEKALCICLLLVFDKFPNLSSDLLEAVDINKIMFASLC